MAIDFSLFLFTVDCNLIRQADRAGIDGFIVDWEHIGKENRQKGCDTQINHNTLEDLRRVRACTDARVICRINSFGAWTRTEVEQAVETGADEILLPMVRNPEEVETVLEWVSDRCGVGILVETTAAILCAAALAKLPLSRAYMGLNDLWIERKSPNLFTAITDQTVERVCQAFSVPFGFAGLTLPGCGFPIPCRLLMGEMVRIGCHFSFLRRSFLRDIVGHKMDVETAGIHQALFESSQRDSIRVAQDRIALDKAIQTWVP